MTYGGTRMRGATHISRPLGPGHTCIGSPVDLTCCRVRPRHVVGLVRRRAGPPCRAVWDDSMTLADLKAQLDAALKVEDYTMAARLRDAIQ